MNTTTAISKKGVEYLKYIDNHVANVRRAFDKYGQALCIISGCRYEDLKELVKVHDKSKYSPEEFEGYRKKYYPTSWEKEHGGPTIELMAEKAWFHHFTNNKHHPEYWVRPSSTNEQPECLPMDRIYILEMLLDWTAMGAVFGDNAYTYWHKNRDSKRMHHETVGLVDTYVEYVKDGL